MTNTDQTETALPSWRSTRERAGLSAVALAKRLNVSEVTIRRFERTDPSMGDLTRNRLELAYRELSRETAAALGIGIVPATTALGAGGGR